MKKNNDGLALLVGTFAAFFFIAFVAMMVESALGLGKPDLFIGWV